MSNRAADGTDNLQQFQNSLHVLRTYTKPTKQKFRLSNAYYSGLQKRLFPIESRSAANINLQLLLPSCLAFIY